MLGPPTIADVPGVAMEDEDPQRRAVAAHLPADQAYAVARERGNPLGREAQPRIRWHQAASRGRHWKHQSILEPGQRAHEPPIPEQRDQQHRPGGARNTKSQSG